MTNLDTGLKSRHITLPTEVHIVFPLVMYGGESWTVKKAERQRVPKNWCLQTAVLEKTPESPLGSKEIKPANLNRNQPQILTGRTEAEGEAAVFWSPDANSQLTGKVPDAGKDWGQKEKRVSEDEMAGWHHRYNEHALGQTLGDAEGQGGLACCSPWGHRVGHDWATEQRKFRSKLSLL